MCHRSNAWTPATFSHNGIASGTCSTCHNGTQAIGKSTNHLPTSQQCDVCHRNNAWKSAPVNEVPPDIPAAEHTRGSPRGMGVGRGFTEVHVSRSSNMLGTPCVCAPNLPDPKVRGHTSASFGINRLVDRVP